MRPDLLRLAGDLAARGEPFALAVVVRRQPASSSQVGDAAVVTAAGEVRGWLGGSCTEPTLVGEALRALADGRPRLLALAPDPEAARRPGVTVFPMTCHSGGSVEIYLEPVLPAPRLLVFGVSPLVRALARLGRAMGYAVTVADPAATAENIPEAERVATDLGALDPGGRAGGLFAVVATMGQRDEEAAAAALALEPVYLGVVASRARGAEIRAALATRGAPGPALDRIKSPAGLDLGARAPEEIALAILAEIVQVRRAGRAGEAGEAAIPAGRREELDPVCGMTVAVAASTPTAEHAGRAYYFCCGGCRERFRADPERYLTAAAAAVLGTPTPAAGGAG
jgi:xanthine dehydrogenase accessory factor